MTTPGYVSYADLRQAVRPEGTVYCPRDRAIVLWRVTAYRRPFAQVSDVPSLPVPDSAILRQEIFTGAHLGGEAYEMAGRWAYRWKDQIEARTAGVIVDADFLPADVSLAARKVLVSVFGESSAVEETK